MQALAKDPAQRFPNVQTFAVALEQAYKRSLVVQHQPVTSQPTYATQSRGIKPIILGQRQVVAPQPTYTPPSREIKPIILGQRQVVAPQPTYTPPSREIKPILLGRKPKKPVRKRRNIWQEIATIFAMDMAIGSVIGIILLMLGLNIQTIWFLISLCLVSTPLLAAYATKNRPVFVISTCILTVASVLGIGFHSPVLFATVYGSLVLLSLLITFSGSLQTFKRR